MKMDCATELEIAQQAQFALTTEAVRLCEHMRRFDGVLRHELRTPMMIIEGYLSLLAEGHGGAMTDAQKEFLAFALEGCGRLRAAVERLQEALEDEAALAALEASSGITGAR